MVTLRQTYRVTALLFLATQIQCRDQNAENNTVREPVQQQAPSTRPSSKDPGDGSMRLKGKGQGLTIEPSIPCRLENLHASQEGAKAQSDPAQTPSVELGVQTPPGDPKGRWTPYVQHRCR